MDIRRLMNAGFRDLQGGLFLDVTKADVGEGAGQFMAAGGDIMAWADAFFPDRSLPESVEAAMRAALDGEMAAHYSMPIGMLPLREAVADFVNARYGFALDPSRNVIITPGSDSGLLLAMMPFIEPGDEVLVPDPSYPSNFLNPKLLGGVTVPVPLRAEVNYEVEIEAFEERVSPRTKMLLITHPNNPTTTVWRRASVEALAEFCMRHDLILVTDQAFEDHIFDGIEFVHPASIEGMWERTVSVCSLSKGFGLSGLRIAYLYADDRIMDIYYGAAVNVIGAASTVSSYGAIAALRDEGLLPSLYTRLERRRDLAYEVLGSIPGVSMKSSESGILSWLDISRLGSSAEAATRIREEARIMVNEGTPYGAQGEGYIRIVSACFARDEDALLRFERIRDCLAGWAAEKGLHA